jgi:hypothetical protein
MIDAMRAIAVKCPNCAARLEVGGTATTATCTYCGTSSRIQARTGFFERPVPATDLPAEAKDLPVASQPHSPRWVLVMILVPVLLAVGIVTAVISATRAGPAAKNLYWYSGGAILTDVTGDGTEDVIGWVLANRKHYIAAFAGESGKRLWRRWIEEDEPGARMLALAGDLLLHTTAGGKVHAFAAADGAPRWEATLGEQVDALCAGDGEALVRTRDERWHRLDLGQGSRADAEEPSPCRALPNDRNFDRQPRGYAYHPGLAGIPTSRFDLPGPRELKGMKVSKLVELEGGGGRWLALGEKHPGTGVPMLARYRVEGYDRSMGSWSEVRHRSGLAVAFPAVWVVEVPGGDPLQASESALDLVGAAGGRVFAAYETRQGPPRVAAFDLEAGARHFDVELPPKEHHSLDHLVATGGRVFVKDRSSLVALDPESGEILYSLGQY